MTTERPPRKRLQLFVDLSAHDLDDLQDILEAVAEDLWQNLQDDPDGGTSSQLTSSRGYSWLLDVDETAPGVDAFDSYLQQWRERRRAARATTATEVTP